MTLSTFLSVVGLIATIVFGIWGIYIVIRRRYPGEITFVINNCIGLFDAIVKNFPDLAVLYHNQPVSHSIVLFKGTVLNSGGKDITPKMVEQQLQLTLPAGFKWLSAKAIETSESVTTTIDTQPGRLEFGTGLFRCGEYFRFEALAEVPILGVKDKYKFIEDRLIEAIKAVHRIADTGKVRVVQLPQGLCPKHRFQKRIIIPTTLFLLGVLYIFVVFFLGMPVETHFMISDSKGGRIEVSAKPNRDGTVRIRSIDKTLDQRVPVQEFFAQTDLQAKVVPDKSAKSLLVVSILTYIVAPSIWLCIVVAEQHKWNKLRRQIGLIT